MLGFVKKGGEEKKLIHTEKNDKYEGMDFYSYNLRQCTCVSALPG